MTVINGHKKDITNEQHATAQAVVNFRQVIDYIHLHNRDRAQKLRDELRQYSNPIKGSIPDVIRNFIKVREIFLEAVRREREWRGSVLLDLPPVPEDDAYYVVNIFENFIPNLLLEHLLECHTDGSSPDYNHLVDSLAVFYSLPPCRLLRHNSKMIKEIGGMLGFSPESTELYIELTGKTFSLEHFIKHGKGVNRAYLDALMDNVSNYHLSLIRYLNQLRGSEMRMRDLSAQYSPRAID